MLREEPIPLAISDEGLTTVAQILVDPSEGPMDQLIRRELQSRVRQALHALAEHDREIIFMRYLEQMPIAEIAAALGIAERAAKSRIRRGLERLHEALQQLDSGSSP